MNADRWIFLLALCFTCASSNDEEFGEYCEEYFGDLCETHRLSAPLGSSVLLPCNFLNNSLNWVSWTYAGAGDLVSLTPEGRIRFLNPRDGRVKAFPNQGSQGNYSICIGDLKISDLGCYRCTLQGHDCLQVILDTTGALREEMMLLIYICVGVAAFIMLGVGGYFCIEGILRCNNRTQDNTNDPAGTEVAGAPPEETGRVPVDEQQRGADNLVYENDDQDPANYLPGALPDLDRTQPTQSIYPSLNQCNSERMEIQRNKHRFHTELFSRLRQASLGRHYYVNQCEISNQQAASTQAENHRRGGLGKKKAKENCEYKNPIYNRSMEQLNQL